MRILISDYDGTFSRGSAEERSRAVSDWQLSGNYFGIASGRPLDNLLQIMNQSNVRCDYLIAHNGMRIADGGGRILQEHCCDGSLLAHLIPVCFQNGCELCAIHWDKMYVLYKQDYKNSIIVDSLDISKIPNFYQISVECGTRETAQTVQQVISERFGDQVSALQNYKSIDIIATGINKEQSIHALVSLCGIKECDVITVGDEINDISMLTAFASYAIETAPVEVKSVANSVVPDIAALIQKEISLD